MLAAVALQASVAGAQNGSQPAVDRVNMQAVAQALGVGCDFCHVAEPGKRPDYAANDKPKKDIARQMMAMTRDLNAKIQAAVGKSATEATRVQCLTCHRGVANPKQLSDIVTQTVIEKGAAVAVAEYRDLRKRYYGRQSPYDFSEDELLGVAQRLVETRPDDAIALVQLNIEFNPRSASSYIIMGYAYTRKRDDASAITSLEKALELEPDNGLARGRLTQLKEYQRKR